ncbi:MAG: DNA polymerase IV [Syntrophomonadaceae bacterium]
MLPFCNGDSTIMSDSNSKLHIIHCDLDAFFASVEQLDHPEFRGRPVIVGGDARSRGVVSTCSYEARKSGVRSAMPMARALRLCPQAVYLPVNMPRYVEMSRQVFSILADYSPLMEPLSIDEAFLDISGTQNLFGSPSDIGRRIKKRVRTELGLIISVGISYNKFLAKLASDISKPDGLMTISREQALEILAPLPVSNLWGVGEKGQDQLRVWGLETIGEVQKLPPGWLEERMGVSGRLCWQLAQGIDHREVEPEREKKSLGREMTFPQDVDDLEYLKQMLKVFAAELCPRLRKIKHSAATISIKLRFNSFKTITRSCTIAACDSEGLTAGIAIQLLEQVYQGSPPLRLIGLTLSNLTPTGDCEQGALFDEQRQKNHSVDLLMDNIRERFGPKSIKRAHLLDVDDKGSW